MGKMESFTVCGTKDNFESVEANAILEAIAKGACVDIVYADIRGDLCIREYIDTGIDRESRLYTIKGDLVITRSNFVGDVDFRQTCFDGYVSLEGLKFKSHASFIKAVFNGRLNIAETIFKQSASFRGVVFEGYADFRGTTFKRIADFRGAVFKKGTDFENAHFHGDARFGGTIFKGRTSTIEGGIGDTEQIGTAVSEYSSIQGRLDRGVLRVSPNLHKADLSGLSAVALDELSWAYKDSSVPGAALFFERSGRTYLSEKKYSSAKNKFRDAKVEYGGDGEYRKADKMFAEEMDAIRRSLRAEKGSSVTRRIWLWACHLGYSILKITCNYGESVPRFAIFMACVIFIFALIYLPIIPNRASWWPDWLTIEFKEAPSGNAFLTALYFSVVTFATLGFGDITPSSGFGKIIVILEVLWGYVTFGILITLVARKITRN